MSDPTWTVSFGSIGATARRPVPNRSMASAWSVVVTPTAAMTRRERRRGAQRAEHQRGGMTSAMADAAATPANRAGHGADTVGDMDGADGKDEIAVSPELVVHERRPHGHRSLGDVDDARAAVGGDQRHRHRGVGRAGAEADDQEQQVVRHDLGVRCARGDRISR